MRTPGANETPQAPSPPSTSDPTIAPTNPMSHTPPVNRPSSFQSTFSYALHVYKKRTKGDLILHPLATRLQSCDSPDAILTILQEQARAIDQSWNAHEKLAMWLDPIVNVLYALSSSLGEGIGLVIIWSCSLGMYAFIFHFPGIITREGHLCWHWYNPHCVYLHRFPCAGHSYP